MNYKVKNIYTEESEEFLKLEDAKAFIVNEVEKLNKGFRHIKPYSAEDFEIYEFNAEKWEWELIK